MNEINETVVARLQKAIGELLNAGWTTSAIRDALSKQASFGKYDGCTPTAIFLMANVMCKQINAEQRKIENEVMGEALATLKRDFPSFAKYFKA
jgi:hypothetical protein